MKYFSSKKCLKPFLPNVGLRRKFFGSSLQGPRIEKRLTLGMPATYRITVQGFIDKSWADRLSGMQITSRGREGQAPVTIFVGRLKDQAELMGVLNSLYELRLPLLSVEIMSIE
jgi:hypothetical protein